MKKYVITRLSGMIMLMMTQISCNKLVEIHPPYNSIDTKETFTDSANAASAIEGMYSVLASGNFSLGFGNGAVGILSGTSADELIPFFSGGDQLYGNILTADNGPVYGYFWSQPYTVIYQANAAIEGVAGSASLAESDKKLFTGEAKFIRAFLYFYLVNFFGDVPFITSTAYKQTQSAPRTSVAVIYDQLITDLKECEQNLPADYGLSDDQRVRATKWAATALLARIYLYQADWPDAESASETLLNETGFFSLAATPGEVFLKNNSEAILQWQLNTTVAPYNSTWEGITLIPYDEFSFPNYYLTPELLSAFEQKDQRKSQWIDSTSFNGTEYFYPKKYNVSSAQVQPGADAPQYPTVLRLAEQLLIHAEALVHQGRFEDAMADVNQLRARAGLDAKSVSTADEAITAILNERRLEFFCEWGHRWLDLKRLNLANEVLSQVKPSWKSFQQLYPIPLTDMKSDPNLVQNPGY